MKTLLLISGVVFCFAGAISLLYAALCRFGYYRTQDGDNALYARLRRRTRLFFPLGLALLCAGVLLLVFRPAG